MSPVVAALEVSVRVLKNNYLSLTSVISHCLSVSLSLSLSLSLFLFLSFPLSITRTHTVYIHVCIYVGTRLCTHRNFLQEATFGRLTLSDRLLELKFQVSHLVLQYPQKYMYM